jgi:hypothetical protein
VTYLKQLDGTVKFNAEAITGLRDNLKSVARKAQEGFQDVATKLAWHKEKEAATTIRRLEFAISRLALSITELRDALEFVSMGKVPLNLISPNVLRVILKKHYCGIARRV